MWIKEVSLRNIRRHESLDLTFSKGTVLLHGKNGCGKSSVIMAIGYVLFGSLPIAQKDFIRRGVKTFDIRIRLEHRGRDVWVRRGSKGMDVNDAITNEILATGIDHSQSVLRDILRLDSSVNVGRLWNDALGVPQGKLTSGFDLTKAQRISYWASLLHLEAYREAFSSLLPLSRVFKDRRTASASAQQAYQTTLDALPVADLDKEEMQAKVRTLEALQSVLAVKLGDLEQQRSAYQVAGAGISRVNIQVQSTAQQLEEAEQAAAALPDMPSLRKRLDELSSIEDPTETYEEQMTYVTRLKETIRQQKKLIVQAELDAAAAQDSHSRGRQLLVEILDASFAEKMAQENVDQDKRHQAELQAELQQRRNRLATLQGSDGPCPVCGGPLDDEHRDELLLECVSLIESGEGQLECMTNSLNKGTGPALQKQQRALRKMRDEQAACYTDEALEKLNEQYKGYLKVLDQHFEESYATEPFTVELTAKVTLFRGAQLELRTVSSQIAEATRLETLASRVPELTDFLVQLKAELTTLQVVTFDVAHYDKVKAEKEATDVELVTLIERLNYVNQVASLNDKIAEETKALAIAQKAVSLVDNARRVIRDAGPALAEFKMQTLLNTARGVYSDLRPHSDPMYWTGDFEAGLGNRPYALLSGGERVALALALRLAISQLEADLSILFLDEPTIHLDADACQGLAELMARLPLEQTFAVSHDSTFIPYVNQVITFTESGVT